MGKLLYAQELITEALPQQPRGAAMGAVEGGSKEGRMYAYS